MSAESDAYERAVAQNINKIPGVKAERPTVGTDYPDVLVKYKERLVFFEVKMNHRDNLANPRVFYQNGRWQTTYKTPAAQHSVNILNQSPDAKRFIQDMSKISGIPINSIKIPTTRGGVKEPGAVPLVIMKNYFERPGVTRYVANKPNLDLGKIVTEHYLKGKTKPAYYMQAGDDFYRISDIDPLGLGKSIPLLKGYGDFKVRVSTRSEFYEVQAEVKILKLPVSDYSLKPGTKKKNPFLK